MANLPRKVGVCNISAGCHEDPPPQPPPLSPSPTSSNNQSFSPYLIFMFCGLAVSFSFICYLLFVARYRSRQRNSANTDDETHDDFVYEDLGPVIDHHPIWLINTIGLEQSQIESIQLFKYKKDQGLTEGTDCSVCLSEFEDDESLRLLPKCSHAFHVPCIDTWLRSHKNCPLCRAPIINNIIAQTVAPTIDSNLSQPSTREETPREDSETVDHHHHVVEVENNGELEKSSRILEETSSGVRANSDLTDHHRVQGDELVPMRRSISMAESSASIVHIAVANVPVSDQKRPLTSQIVRSKKPNSIPKSGHKHKGSSSSFRIRSKIAKSSSVGHSSQKASSININTNKSPYNRSY